MSIVERLVLEEEGADAAEYALVIGLVALAIVVGAIALGGQLNNAFNHESTCIQTEINTKAPC